MDRQLVMVQLFCDEGASSPETVAAGSRRRSFADPHLCADGRVLTSMLRAEDGQLPSTTGHVARRLLSERLAAADETHGRQLDARGIRTRHCRRRHRTAWWN